MTVTTPGSALGAAHQRALSADQRIDRLNLKPVERSLPSFSVADRLVSATSILTTEGASSVEIGVLDENWRVEESGILTLGGDGRLKTLDIVLDGVVYRMVKGKRPRGSDVLSLTFEDRVAALLHAHSGHMSASRGTITRAKFIERMVREVRVVDIPYYAPEKGRRQPAERPDYPSTAPARGETGFDQGARLTLRQWDDSEAVLDGHQMGNAATALGVADQLDAGPKATLALMEAGIVEAPMFSNPEGGEGTSSGMLQLIDSHLDGSTSVHGGRRDVALVSRIFLTKGFAGRGGAIDLARQHTEWTAGQVAQAVQSSGYATRYDQVRASARKVIAAYNHGDQAGAETDDVLRVREFDFTRGIPSDPHENSWDAAVRLADEVNWRFYAAGGVAAFISDDRLLMNPAAVVIRDLDELGLLEKPGYDVDHGKVADELDVRVNADRWSLVPGGVWAFLGDHWGPAEGRVIARTIEENLLAADDCTVTLAKPQATRKEPSAEVLSVSTATGGGGDSTGADRALRWARSKLGHYKESFANNRGAELDKLETQFGMRGAPWCAIFATTAVSKGGVPNDCKTAAVARIRQWATDGSHGYERGFRASPRPGDLMLFANDHVAFVEKVTGDSVGTIEGNTSANKVARGTRARGSGDFVRPDYPD